MCLGSSSALADSVPPTVLINSPVPGQHFFQNQIVNSSFSCHDNIGGSGVKNCIGPAQVNTSTVGTHLFTVTATDFDNNTADGNVTYVVDPPDTTAPTITIVTPAEGQHFGQNAHVVAQFSCADNAGGIGIATCSGPGTVDTSTLGANTFTVNATDAAGNPASKTVNYVVDPGDTTAPAIVVTTPASGQHFVHNDSVASVFSCSDSPGGTGVATCDGPATVDTSTVGAHAFTVTSTDNTGNTSVANVGYFVDADDTTAPTVAIATPAAGQHFAQGASVPSSFSCTDNPGGGGISSCAGAAFIDTAAPGAHTFTATAIDHAGNFATASVNYVVDAAPATPDTTAPAITIARPLANQHFVQGAAIASSFSCADNAGGSGVATCTGPAAIDTGTVGTRTFTVTARDNAGNTSATTVSYIVDKFVITGPGITVPIIPATNTKADKVITALKGLYSKSTLTLSTSSTYTLKFTAPFAGVLTVHWGSKKTTVANNSIAFGKAGTKKLTLKLTKAGKKLLNASKTHRLSISSKATFAPDSGGPHSRTKQLTIKRHA